MVRPLVFCLVQNKHQANEWEQRNYEALGPLLPPSTSDRDWINEGFITELNRRDDHDHLPAWKRYLYYITPFLAAATLGAYWLYLILRVLFVLSAQRQYKAFFPMAWTFIAIEILVAVPMFLHLFWAMFIWKRRRRPQLRLVGDDVPTVDVLITCCNEDVDLLFDTIHATCEVDYPRDRFRVLVLDDGNSTKLRNAVSMLQDTYPNLFYRSRKKFPGVPHHFKAGNLNFGVQETKYLPGGQAHFLAALDADSKHHSFSICDGNLTCFK